MTMISPDKMNEQLIELQTQLTYQDDTIQTLNDMVARQQQDIMDLNRKIDNLVDELKVALESSGASNISTMIEKPPHY